MRETMATWPDACGGCSTINERSSLVVARQSTGRWGHVQGGLGRALRPRHDQAGGQRLLGRAPRAADEEGLAGGRGRAEPRSGAAAGSVRSRGGGNAV